METRAVLRGVRLSVDKGRLVADLIRGKKVDQALNILNFTQKKAAGIVKNCWSRRLPTLSTTTVLTLMNCVSKPFTWNKAQPSSDSPHAPRAVATASASPRAMCT